MSGHPHSGRSISFIELYLHAFILCVIISQRNVEENQPESQEGVETFQTGECKGN